MLDGLISAGANLLGGLLGKSSADEARAASERMAAQNIALQKEFAQNGLTWKIDDAFRNADRVHPIYSLGASGASFTPVSANFTADTSMANAVSAAGQNIGRAVNATASASQRQNAFTKAAGALELEGKSLDNDLKRAQLASETARLRQVSAPALPQAGDSASYLIPGQGNSPLIKNKPLEVAPAPSNAPHAEGGAISDVGFARTTTGWAPVPSNDVKQRIEDNLIQELMWSFRNNVMPTFGYNKAPPPFQAPEGKMWIYSFPHQEYRLVPKKKTAYGDEVGEGWYIR